MAEVMIPARGCVYMPKGSRGGDGFYALSPHLRGSSDSPIILEGADISLSDIIYPVATLDSKKFIFEMGDDFGNVGISGAALLGKAELGGHSFSAVKSYFDSHRSARGGRAINISLPGKAAYKFYLTGFGIMKPDPQFHIQFFQFRGIIAEPRSA